MGVFVVAGSIGVITAGCVGDDPNAVPTTPDAGTSSPEAGTDPPDGALTPDAGALAPDAAPSLNCPINCLPPAPEGWTGPSAIYDGPFASAPAACPEQYTLEEVVATRDLAVAATTCECGAPTFSGASCNFTTTTYSGNGCEYGVVTNTQTSGACYQHNVNAVRVSSASLATSGSCTFPTPAAVKPEPVPGIATKACGLPQTASCSSERSDCTATPLPTSPFSRLCIHKAGDQACPSADYAVKIVSYLDVTDDRDCTACTGTAAGGTCPTVFGWSNMNFCTGPSGTNRAIGSTCWTPVEGSRLVFFNPTGMTCNVAAAGTPTGAVEPVDPVTFCCAK
jgi:hypothetical protein